MRRWQRISPAQRPRRSNSIRIHFARRRPPRRWPRTAHRTPPGVPPRVRSQETSAPSGAPTWGLTSAAVVSTSSSRFGLRGPWPRATVRRGLLSPSRPGRPPGERRAPCSGPMTGERPSGLTPGASGRGHRAPDGDPGVLRGPAPVPAEAPAVASSLAAGAAARAAPGLSSLSMRRSPRALLERRESPTSGGSPPRPPGSPPTGTGTRPGLPSQAAAQLWAPEPARPPRDVNRRVRRHGPARGGGPAEQDPHATWLGASSPRSHEPPRPTP